MNAPAPLLSVRALDIRIAGASALSDVSFRIERGRTLGVVGESGSGKSLLSLACIGLLPPGASASGEIAFEGTALLGAGERVWNAHRGRRIAAVFQEPMTALNPAMRVGAQVAEAIRLDGVPRRLAQERTVALLDRVRLESPARSARAYPHQLSGGQRQRVSIAMALAREPALLIADEPTTALDAGVQRDILDLLAELARERGLAMLLVSHDLSVVARAADETLVLYAGARLEHGPTADLLKAPRNPYTEALLEARLRRRTGPAGRLPTIAGTVPALGQRLPGCRFAPRCRFRQDRCEDGEPAWTKTDEQGVRCVRADEWRAVP